MKNIYAQGNRFPIGMVVLLITHTLLWSAYFSPISATELGAQERCKERVFGYPNIKKTWATVNFPENASTEQVGISLNISRRTTLKELTLNVHHSTTDSMFFRLNIYQLERGIPTKTLWGPIYYRLPILNHKISADLSSYGIVVSQKVLVAIERIERKGDIELPASALLGRVYYRKTGQSNWSSGPLAIGMSVAACVEK